MVIILIVTLNYPHAIVQFDEGKRHAFEFEKEEIPLTFDLGSEILLPSCPASSTIPSEHVIYCAKVFCCCEMVYGGKAGRVGRAGEAGKARKGGMMLGRSKKA